MTFFLVAIFLNRLVETRKANYSINYSILTYDNSQFGCHAAGRVATWSGLAGVLYYFFVNAVQCVLLLFNCLYYLYVYVYCVFFCHIFK